MDNEQRLDAAIGQIGVLKSFCIALIISYPHPEKLLRQFDSNGEMTLANLLPTQASEQLITAALNMKKDWVNILQDQAQYRASGDNDQQSQ